MKAWLLARASEHTTWAGIAGLLALFGYRYDPEALAQVGQLAVAVVGSAFIVIGDKKQA